MLAAGDLDAARRGVDELAEIAGIYGTPALTAEASPARGAVLLADGDARAALVPLRESVKLWRGSMRRTTRHKRGWSSP